MILGYKANGEPIREPKAGMIYTAAYIFCSKCKEGISHCGGPSFGAVCLACHEENKKEETK